MIRGCQKKILFVEGNENSPFETAYFVLRKDAESGASGEDDIVRAADMIINERLPEENRKQKKRERLKRIFLFLLSAVCGSVIGGGAVALLMVLS